MNNETLRIELTQSPKAKTPESQLGFGTTYTDHLFVMDYDQGQGWHDPRIIPFQDLVMNPAAGALHYGQAVFEGLKAYNHHGKITLFRPDRNFARLNASLERIVLPQIDEKMALHYLKEFLKVERSWVPCTENTSLYIRPFVFNNEPYLGVHPAQKALFVIMASPSGAYFNGGLQPTRIFVEDEYVRAVKGGVGHTKTAGNYAASFKGQLKAEQYHCHQCLWLDAKEHQYVEEVGAMNIFFKIKGEYYTPALSGSILPGVTRDSVLQLLRSRGQIVHETRISIDSLFEMAQTGELEEVFGTGTAAVITPVGTLVRVQKNGEVQEALINGGQTGPMTEALFNSLTRIQLGLDKDPFNWVVHVCDTE